MQTYEINYLVLQSRNAKLEKLRGSVKELLKKSGAQITEEKEYLKRKLAYEIKHEGYGFYTALRFKIEEKDKLDSIKKDLNLNYDIVRYIIIGADNLPSLKESEEAAKRQKEPVAKKEAKNETIKAEDVEKMISKSAAEIEEPAAKQAQQTKTANEEKIQPEEKEEGAEKKDDKNSLDELDKKLDEILNI